jgi:hypothetical protein
MKKLVIVFLSLLVAFQCVVVSGAALYEGDSRYTIDLPEGFSQMGDNNFTADDESGFSVTFEDNVEEQFSVADMSEKDIASALSISQGTVKSRLSRARGILSKIYKEELL